MSAHWLNLILTMALCFLAWGLFHAVLYRMGMGYTRHFAWTTGYFVLVLLGICALFWPQVAFVLLPVVPAPLAVLVVFILCQIIWCYWLKKKFKEPIDYLRRYPDRYYLEVSWERLVSKSADIAAQQAFIIVLVVSLQEAGLVTYRILGLFFVLFALLHVPLIAREWGAWPSWVFASAVVAFSIIFPLLILHVPYGFVYAYIIHWLFYMTTASIFWMHARHQQAQRRSSPVQRRGGKV